MESTIKARDYGVETEYIDALGERRVVSGETIDLVLHSLSPPPRHALVDGTLVMRPGVPPSPRVRDAAAMPLDWVVYRDEVDGLREIARARSGRWPFSAAQWPAGVYRVKLVDANGERDEVPLVVAPQQAFAGEFARVWVLAVQLYGLRSQGNWGIGDFGDLLEVVRRAARAGAAGIGLNPLHVLFDDHPADCSPYSPSSRLFLNPLYIDVSRVPGFAAADVSGLQDRLAALRQAEFVDYRAVAELKWSSLRAAFARFMAAGATDERAAFAEYRRDAGKTLVRFACFEFLRHSNAGPWWDWPPQWREPDDDRLQDLHDGEAADAIAYFAFLQWIADRQLCQCRELARELKMPIGLYLDVAVGVKMDGFDAWNAPSAIARQLSVGAPPDQLNTAGQNWGLAAFNAAGLEATLYQPYRDMLAAVMRHAGAIRLDHVLGLQRLFLIPPDRTAGEGVYLRMPLEALLGVIAMESQRHRCVVVGEDLGTVPDGFRARLSEHGIWGYRVMLFERNHDGSFLAPEHYAANALVTFNTHDLPTFAGWRTGHDMAVKRGLGLDPGETDEDRRCSLRWLEEATGAADAGRDVDNAFDSALGFLSRTPSRILAVALEDLLGVADQPNIPGTIDQYPNWRRKLHVPLEALDAALDPIRLRRLLAGRSLSDNATD